MRVGVLATTGASRKDLAASPPRQQPSHRRPTRLRTIGLSWKGFDCRASLVANVGAADNHFLRDGGGADDPVVVATTTSSDDDGYDEYLLGYDDVDDATTVTTGTSSVDDATTVTTATSSVDDAMAVTTYMSGDDDEYDEYDNGYDYGYRARYGGYGGNGDGSYGGDGDDNNRVADPGGGAWPFGAPKHAVIFFCKTFLCAETLADHAEPPVEY